MPFLANFLFCFHKETITYLPLNKSDLIKLLPTLFLQWICKSWKFAMFLVTMNYDFMVLTSLRRYTIFLQFWCGVVNLIRNWGILIGKWWVLLKNCKACWKCDVSIRILYRPQTNLKLFASRKSSGVPQKNLSKKSSKFHIWKKKPRKENHKTQHFIIDSQKSNYKTR